MQITPQFKGIKGSFDTQTNKMICIANYQGGYIELAFKETNCDWNFPIATIKIYGSNLRKDFEQTFEHAQKLGEEIARRWNNCIDKE